MAPEFKAGDRVKMHDADRADAIPAYRGMRGTVVDADHPDVLTAHRRGSAHVLPGRVGYWVSWDMDRGFGASWVLVEYLALAGEVTP